MGFSYEFHYCPKLLWTTQYWLPLSTEYHSFLQIVQFQWLPISIPLIYNNFKFKRNIFREYRLVKSNYSNLN